MEISRSRIWPLPLGVIGSVGIFMATFYAYAEREHDKQGGSTVPMLVGISAFVVLMLFLTLLMLPKGMSKVRMTITTLAIVAIETMAFVYAIFFLLLNIYGS